MHDYALGLIQRKLEAAPSEATLDVCLTQVGARRAIYDKFIALRDTARGLAFATVIAGVLVIWDDWGPLTSGGWWYAVVKVGGSIVLSLGLSLAFIQRFNPTGACVDNASGSLRARLRSGYS